jgi:hypothetical protein
MTVYKKMFGLSQPEVAQALKRIATGGEGGGIMTTYTATDTIMAIRTARSC